MNELEWTMLALGLLYIGYRAGLVGSLIYLTPILVVAGLFWVIREFGGPVGEWVNIALFLTGVLIFSIWSYIKSNHMKSPEKEDEEDY